MGDGEHDPPAWMEQKPDHQFFLNIVHILL